MDDAGKQDWSALQESHKAWMSVRDADLLEELIMRLRQCRAGEKLRVVEWGGGRSTCWYTSVLDYAKVPYSWLMLEHNRDFFDKEILGVLQHRRNFHLSYGDALLQETGGRFAGMDGVIAAVFDHSFVSPYDTKIYEHRLVDMDAYVNLPAQLGASCDLAIIDGRKRRRCVLEGGKLVGDTGYVVLHDAWRTHYQCAWKEFRSGRRFGDEWWIGANHDTNFEDVLPWYAFGRHASSG